MESFESNRDAAKVFRNIIIRVGKRTAAPVKHVVRCKAARHGSVASSNTQGKSQASVSDMHQRGNAGEPQEL